MYKLTQSVTKSIISDRESGNSLQKLANRYGFRWQNIKQILIDFGEYKDTRHAHTKNSWNEYFFDDKNQISAYWSGFTFADGCVTPQKYGTRVHIIVQESDGGHLEEFANAINFPPEKIYRNKTKSRTIQIHTHRKKDFTDALREWGIVSRKSYNFVEPNIPQNLVPHFMRGWLDGDGHISNKPGYQRLDIVGNSFGIDWYVDNLRKLGYSGHINVYGKDDKVWKHLLVTGVRQIRYIAELLHSDNPDLPKLDRKWLHLFK